MVQSRAGTPGTVGLVVRMPEDLRDRIKAAADASGRSQNSEIVATLEEKYPAPVATSADLLPIGEWLSQIEQTRDPDKRAEKIDELNRFLSASPANAKFTAMLDAEGRAIIHLKR